LLTQISEPAIMNFFKLWSKRNADDEFYAIDTTSISSYSNSILEVEFGKNKDNDNLPQINVLLAAGVKSKLPLFYRLLPGSIHDVSTVINTIKYVKNITNKKVKIVMDRGFDSVENISNLCARGIKFIQGMKQNILIKEYIDKARDKFDIDSFIDFGDNGTCDGISFKVDYNSNSLTAYVFYDKQRQHDEEVEFKRKIKEFAIKAIGKPISDFKNEYTRFFISQNDIIQRFRIAKIQVD
jgi:transposase